MSLNVTFKNPQIMKCFSENLETSKNTLIYSLRLNKAFSIDGTALGSLDENFPQYVKLLTNTIWDDCKTFMCDHTFNFFGYENYYSASSHASDPSSSDPSSSEPNSSNSNSSASRGCSDLSILPNSTKFWKHMFLQDAILFSFDKLRKLIGESCPVKPYEHVRLSNCCVLSDEFNHSFTGLDYLTNEDSNSPSAYSLLVGNDGIPSIIKNDTYLSVHPTIMYSKYAKSYQKRVNELNNKIEDTNLNASSLYLHQTDSKLPASYQQGVSFPISLLEFYDLLVDRKIRAKEEDSKSKIKKQPTTTGFSNILNSYKSGKPFSQSQYIHYINSISKLLYNINADFIDITYDDCKDPLSCYLKPSDKIYLMYQIEKMFGISTINCIYQNIVPTNNSPYSLCDQDNINWISSVLRLPNVFTRQYLVQMSVDTISKHYDYDFKDYDFFSKMSDSTDTIVKLVHSYNNLTNISKLGIWKNRYHRLMEYLSRFLFPIFENYFFCSLWDIVKKNSSDTCIEPMPEEMANGFKITNVSKNLSKLSNAETAVKMYKLLRQYLNNQQSRNALFNIENSIINSEEKWTDFDANKFIRPDFSNYSDVDYTLYKKCLLAHTSSFQKEPFDDFISPAYFDKLSSSTKAKIQTQYSLDSITKI